MKAMYLTDVTQAETDDMCGMRYWFRYKESGNGIVSTSTLPKQIIDEALHQDLRVIAGMEDISFKTVEALIIEVLKGLSDSDKRDIRKMELLYRRLGLVAAFALYVEPRIRETFETIPIEEELVLDAEPLWVMTYPDRLLRSRLNGDVVYREYEMVPPGITLDRWMQSWVYRVRLHVGLAAAKQAMGLAKATGAKVTNIEFAQIMGMISGHHSYRDGRLVHPYVYGYENMQTGSWQSHPPPAAEGGWIVKPTWEYPGGITEWAQLCGREVANTQFPLSPLVRQNQHHLAGWITRRIHRMRKLDGVTEVCKVNQDARNIHFERHTENCKPAVGENCPYLSACWLPALAKDPLIDEQYIPVVAP